MPIHDYLINYNLHIKGPPLSGKTKWINYVVEEYTNVMILSYNYILPTNRRHTQHFTSLNHFVSRMTPYMIQSNQDIQSIVDTLDVNSVGDYDVVVVDDFHLFKPLQIELLKKIKTKRWAILSCDYYPTFYNFLPVPYKQVEWNETVMNQSKVNFLNNMSSRLMLRTTICSINSIITHNTVNALRYISKYMGRYNYSDIMIVVPNLHDTTIENYIAEHFNAVVHIVMDDRTYPLRFNQEHMQGKLIITTPNSAYHIRRDILICVDIVAPDKLFYLIPYPKLVININTGLRYEDRLPCQPEIPSNTTASYIQSATTTIQLPYAITIHSEDGIVHSEDIHWIHGTAIMFLYEWICTSKVNFVSEMIVNGFQKKVARVSQIDIIAIADLLRHYPKRVDYVTVTNMTILTVCFRCYFNKILTPLKQVTRYDFIPVDTVKQLIGRLSSTIGTQNLLFEHAMTVAKKSYYVDIVDHTNKVYYEIKYCHYLTHDILYKAKAIASTLPDGYKFILYNMRDNTMLDLSVKPIDVNSFDISAPILQT